MIIDGNKTILGRLGTFVAKKALLGEKIDIVNCENCMVTGTKKEILAHYKKLFARGIPSKGPFFFKMPDKFVKRSIRGMLPYKAERGRKAFESIKCYIGVPSEFSGKKFETVEGGNVDKVPNSKYLTVKEICNHMGANIK